jgi:hypothetical protein
MALTFEYAITAVQSDCSTNTLSDATVYGNGEDERHQRANYVIASKNDTAGTPSYITIDNSAAHNISGQADLNDYVPDEIIFPTAVDGWYQFFILSCPLYAGSTDYQAETVVGDSNDFSVVYYVTDNTFYKCLTANGPSNGGDVLPGADPLVWEALSVASTDTVATWVPIIDNTQIDTHQHDDLVTCYAENCMVRLLETAVDEGLCKDCDQFGKIHAYMRVDILVNGANAKNYENKLAEAEEIARFLENYCASC